MSPRRVRLRRALYASLGVAALLGCQVIVSSDVPEFSCASADPSACPSGMTCDVAAGRCVAGGSEGGEGGGGPSGDGGDASNDRHDAASPSLGKTCNTDLDCPDGLICGTNTILTPEVLGTSAQPICTKPCCTSTDCPDSFVCFGAATGGNYCVSADRASRSAPGAKRGGETCSTGSECRSGLCDDGHCVDSCCSASDCASGSVCRRTTVDVPPPTKETWSCAAPVAGANLDFGDDCIGPICPPEASSGNCCENQNCGGVPRVCRPTCCGPADCLGYGGDFAVCAYSNFGSTDSKTKFCIDRNSAPGTLGLGEQCQGNLECSSYLCDRDTKKCTTACCQDKDCAVDQACRPGSDGLLRCVPKAQ